MCSLFPLFSSIRLSNGDVETILGSQRESFVADVGKVASFAGNAVATFATSNLFSLATATSVNAKSKDIWEKIELPVRETLFDISFDPSKPDHGWIVGAKGTFFETFDGGDSWIPRSFSNLDEDEEINYRFEVASLGGNEGWIIGKPSIMLHTRDGGKQFERIPVSPKLPGDPTSIVATGPSNAEMITTQGAIYTTVNGGLNWKAQVKETIDATLNRVSSSGTSGASFFTGKLANQVLCCPDMLFVGLNFSFKDS